MTAFVNSMLDQSSVGLSYSIDTLMDAICICFVAWHLRAQTRDDLKRRDYLVCCVIGALFIGSFLAIESRAIQSMIVPQEPSGDCKHAYFDDLIQVMMALFLFVIGWKLIIEGIGYMNTTYAETIARERPNYEPNTCLLPNRDHADIQQPPTTSIDNSNATQTV
ncbi:unnamed protein product [Didymodactylos carnosus]|uniref:Uncharacterized protein n=1 Tax=Didymodactylos carnosus TaxID=1234261 RepID=A0A813QM15_9BILA|nr:unnamed protein product [Didymodactylos carnosus]CAF3550322.1 unnamed protein product [Didymodactylos carnosus]